MIGKLSSQAAELLHELAVKTGRLDTQRALAKYNVWQLPDFREAIGTERLAGSRAMLFHQIPDMGWRFASEAEQIEHLSLMPQPQALVRRLEECCGDTCFFQINLFSSGQGLSPQGRGWTLSS